MNYITLCVCQHKDSDKLYLFKAPTFTEIKDGTKVIVDTNLGEQEAIVVSSCTVAKESKEFETMMNLAGAYGELKKVVGYYKFIEYDYSNDEGVKDNERSDSKH